MDPLSPRQDFLSPHEHIVAVAVSAKDDLCFLNRIFNCVTLHLLGLALYRTVGPAYKIVPFYLLVVFSDGLSSLALMIVTASLTLWTDF